MLVDDAIVLRLTEYSESSQIVSAFTPTQGLVRVIAKGIRRSTKAKFSAGLDFLERGTISFYPPRGDAALGTLGEWRQLDGYVGLRRDLPRLYGALYAAELTSALVQEFDPHPALYEALAELLAALSDLPPGAARRAVDDSPAHAVARFQAALLAEIGYAPNFAQCMECGATRLPERMPYFSAAAGGLLCRDCEMHHVEKRHVPPGLAGTQPGRDRAADWLELQHYALRHVAGREFQTARTALPALTRRSAPSK